MTWSYIRIAIFSTSFIIGLLFSNSGDRAVEMKINAAQPSQNVHESKDGRCAERNLTLVRADFQAHPVSFKSQ
jgi:hypothetical protein